MIVIYGEILLDVMQKGLDAKAHVGGAPFNVYYTISKLKGNSVFVGSVGKDDYGNIIREYVKKAGLSAKYIAYDDNPKHATTLAMVTLDENNDRSFKFIRDPGADVFLKEEAKLILNDPVDIVHIGSLMLSSDYGRNYANDLIKISKKKGYNVSFDVNYRDDIYPNSKKAIKIYNEIIDNANIVKYSEDEVAMFSGIIDIKEGIKKIARKNQRVFVTLGKRGSLYYYDGKFIEVPTVEVKPVDTTGAGDAFYATMLTYIDNAGIDNFFNNDELIKEALRKANIMGATATLKEGAVSSILSKEELDKR